MIRVGLFIICTIFFVRFSWRALANPGTHGFYRFFVFEGILLLVLLNHPYWFRDPFSAQHLLSWCLLLTSIFFVFHSFLTLKRRGGHGEREEMPENHSFENTVHVVEEGLFRYIRHPMYSSLLFLGWGAFFKHITPLNTGLILLVSALLIAVAKVEERENIRFFGPVYEEYMQRTRMFVPWVL
ncbi:MAG: isoprenylcysteine carboxylmethyltransferase family protein [Proteobacteria bacterium]|nr:isoprenylcysteine carboxylmethyltransferase family protein [Pseudomonadota bacterium]MBU1232080.1 isoprenylcysteine carboxylmethyltransferase family protein [Pseudomonadota bacterium]MBU1416882.1 isoprenylcysteine carboxylmethyltransferase family protein [Pseudomonadota bacterium]MBU1454712.1 isoprenylcysteine carboxylmethyltransferase family protein [Pseudomonadota bacterium]